MRFGVYNKSKICGMGWVSVLKITTLLLSVVFLLYSCPADGNGTSSPPETPIPEPDPDPDPEPEPQTPIAEEIREKNPTILYNADMGENAQSLFSKGALDNPYLFTFGVTSVYLLEEIHGEMTITGDTDNDGMVEELYKRNVPLESFVAARKTLVKNKAVLNKMYVMDSNTLKHAREGTIANAVSPVYGEGDHIVGVGLHGVDLIDYDALPENLTLRVRIRYGKEVLKEKTVQASKTDPYEIRTWRDLQHMNDDLTGNYELQNDIIFPEVGEYGYTNFHPIGWDSSPADYSESPGYIYLKNAFRGTFEGNNYKIEGLYIHNTTGISTGLFGLVTFGLGLQQARIRNVTVHHVGITGAGLFTGGLVGFLRGPSLMQAGDRTGTVIENSHVYAMNGAQVEGKRKAWSGTGGLIGDASPFDFVLDNVSAHTDVKGHDAIGGLVGRTLYFHIKNSYATGNVYGNALVGGLVGRLFGGVVRNSYATGNVRGSTHVGGLVGSMEGGRSVGYATGSVKGNANVGGLVGFSIVNGTVIGYTTGDVEGVTNVGGVVGGNDLHWYYTGGTQRTNKKAGYVTIKGYSTGKITSTNYVGGVMGYAGALAVTLAGYTRGTIQFSHADTAGSMLGGLGGSVNSRNINGYASTAGSNSNGVNGERIIISEVTDDNYQTVFQHLTFGEGEGQWTWAGAGKWPAINIGDTAPVDDQPVQ